MKLGLLILVMFSFISCGKNAFREKESDNRVTDRRDSTPDENDCVKPAYVVLNALSHKKLMHADLPFVFKEYGLGDYTSVLSQFGNIKVVEEAQIELPFDFDELREINATIKNVYFTFDTNQVFRRDWHHESQICHSFNKTCSGNLSDVDDHLNPRQHFTWLDDSFSKYVDSFTAYNLGDGYSQRIFSGMKDMLPYFTKDLNLMDLPADYFIVVSDDHYLTNAKLHIEFCPIR